MDNKDDRGSPEVVLPPLFYYIAANQSAAGFDDIEMNSPANRQGLESLSPISHHHKHSISISMPTTPLKSVEEDPFSGRDLDGVLSSPKSGVNGLAPPVFHSQPIALGAGNVGAMGTEYLRNPAIDRFKDRRFDSFKTWSGRLERQLTNLRGKSPRAPEPEETNVVPSAETGSVPVDRYFDALEGPELDTLRATEESVLPEDKKWPFLLRFPVSSFGVCLGVSSQAIMWKTLATSKSTNFLHISPMINVVLWTISLALVAIISAIYILKLILYFEAVRREYYHPIRVNFFFAPWIALLFLALGAPPSVARNLHQALWYVLMTPILVLEVKIYGQWMSGGQRRLSKVANPSNHLSVVGNFVVSLLGATMGLKEGPIFFFAIGLAHYTVLFVTLYQRLPTNETLPKELHPVFFLFVAAPSVASMAWANIQGSFDHGSRIAYFIAMFLYFSLAVRINFFRGFKFSLAWWAYTFPMTGAAIATIRYANEVTSVVTRTLSVTLSTISTLAVTYLLITTILHAFVLRDLFPNDDAIAISNRKPKQNKNWFPNFHLRRGSSAAEEIDNYLKFACTDGKDLEASLRHSSVDPVSSDNV